MAIEYSPSYSAALRIQQTETDRIQRLFNQQRFESIFHSIMEVVHPDNSEITTLTPEQRTTISSGLGFIWETLEAFTSDTTPELNMTTKASGDDLISINLLSTTAEAAERIKGGTTPDYNFLDLRFNRAPKSGPAELRLIEYYTRRKVTNATLVSASEQRGETEYPITLSDDRRTTKFYTVKKNIGGIIPEGFIVLGDYLIKLDSKVATGQHYHVITDAPEFVVLKDERLEVTPKELTPVEISAGDIARLVFTFWKGLSFDTTPDTTPQPTEKSG